MFHICFPNSIYRMLFEGCWGMGSQNYASFVEDDSSLAKEQKSSAPFNGLSPELHINILRFCDQQTIIKVSTCSKYLFDLSCDNALWVDFAERNSIDNLDKNRNFRDQIKNRYTHLKGLLLSYEAFECENYKGMLKTLEWAIMQGRNLENAIYCISKQPSEEDFLDRLKIILQIKGARNKLKLEMTDLYSSYVKKCKIDKVDAFKNASFMNVFLNSSLSLDYNDIYKLMTPSFIKPLIEKHKWQPTADMYTALIRYGINKTPEFCEAIKVFNMPLDHYMGRGVLNEKVEKCDLNQVKELIQYVNPELLTLQLAMKQVIVHKNPNALEIISLILEEVAHWRILGAFQATDWLQNFDKSEKSLFSASTKKYYCSSSPLAKSIKI
jgi:hypothetical protein